MANLSAWLSEVEAAGMLQVSTRTLRRMALLPDGPQREQRPVPGRNSPEACYNPRDIERWIQKRGPQAKVIPRGSMLEPPPPPPPAVRPQGSGAMVSFNWAPILEFLEPLRAVAVRAIEPPPPPAPVLPWITPAEASKVLGLSEGLVRKLIRTGKLPFMRDGHGYKVNRSDLDKLTGMTKLSEVREEIRETVKARRAG